MTTLRPYPEYKASDVNWFGKAPIHWEVLPNRALFREVIQKGHADEQLLSVTIGRGVITQDSLLESSSKKDSSNQDKASYKLVEPGDVAYNKMRAWQGALGVSDYKGIVSPAYIIMRPIKGQHPRFLHYLYRTPAFASEAERWSYGITSDQWSLRSEHFKCIYALLPPLDEQWAIADFLDAMDERITRFIAARRRMIALLEEQKQAIINQAVTRGLDPDVPMKPSGIDWLGEIPAHWTISVLRYLGSKFGSGVTPRGGASTYTSEGVIFLRSQNVHFDGLRLDDVAHISDQVDEEMPNSRVQPKDILLNITGASIGRCCVVPDGIGRANVNQHVCIVRPITTKVSPAFLLNYIRTTQIQSLIQQVSSGAAREGLTLDDMKAFPVVLPPLSEQIAIVEFVRHETGTIFRVVLQHQREMELIQEYRTRLISDVVTGKLDVRGVDLPRLDNDFHALIDTAMDEDPCETEVLDEA